MIYNKSAQSKIFKEIDHKLNDIDKNVCLLFTITNPTQISKKLSILTKDLEHTYKFIFDIKNFTIETFEFIIERNIINLLISYLGLQNVELIKIILNILDKILFESKYFLEKIDLTEEILLMNISIITSLKILIHMLISTIKENNNSDSNLLKSMINFLNNFLKKLIIYPNFYNAIASSNSQDENNFDSALFELIIEIFSKDFLMTERENKIKIRKTLLLCLNLEYFYTISVEYIEKLLKYLVDNLIKYYGDFKSEKIEQNKNNKSSSLNFFTSKKEKSSINSINIEELFRIDLEEYLKYFSIMLHCFAQVEMKNFVSVLIFNKLFLENIQRDILNSYVMKEKIYKTFEFVYLMTKFVRNKEICDIFFCFFFGFNNSEDIFNNEKINDDELINNFNHNENNFDDEINDNSLADYQDDQMMTIRDIQLNIESLINNNNNSIKEKSYFNLELNKSHHKFENILSHLINIIEAQSDNENILDMKIILLKLMKNLVKNSSNLFIVEILIPFYLNYINLQSKNSDKILEKLKSKRDQINLVEILKNIHPNYFSLNLSDWNEYFESSLEKNYNRNIFMLENLDFNETLINDYSDSNNSNFFLDNNCYNSNLTISEKSIITSRKLNFGSSTTESEYNNIYNSITLSPNQMESSLNSMNNISSNVVFNIRIQFYEVLTKYFKKFTENKYKENLFIIELFIEIFSLPYLIQKENNYNIYSNVTFANKKKFILYKISSVGMTSEITQKLDEIIKYNFKIEELNNLLKMRRESNGKDKDGEKNNLNKKEKTNPNNNENNLLDNILLFQEYFKEYIATIFSKCYFDQINSNYTKLILRDEEIINK